MRFRVRPGIHRLFLVLGLLVVGWSTAQALGPAPIKNWAAPSSWTPPVQATGRTALFTYPPLPFIPLTPCRVVDTRSGSGFPAGYGPPSLVALATRSFVIGGQCGIPFSAQAVSFQFTAVNMTAGGNFRAWPSGDVMPTASVLNWTATQAVAGNGIVVPVGGTALNVYLNGPAASTVDLVLDVNGYYSNVTPGYPFAISGSQPNNGVIFGFNTGLGLFDYGYGVVGLTDGTNGSSGVLGYVPDITNAYGVKGRVGSDHYNGYPSGSWGVVGAGGFGGVWGSYDSTKTNAVGVMGSFMNSGFVTDGGGKLAYKLGATTYGVFSNGDFGGTGAKYFVEPHPTDADKVIRYVALEGPEAGTYFRGTARTSGKKAVIEVPESFRIVTDEEGLTVQLTPIGELATLAVVERDLNRIVVRSSADVSFDYHVHGVRRAFKDHEAIAEGSEFRPASPSSRLPSYLPEESRKRLVENGTYNRDGTVNLGMAQRRGWTKAWEEEARQKSAK